MRHWFDIRDIWLRVAERDGALVGYLDVTREENDTRFQIDARAAGRRGGARAARGRGGLLPRDGGPWAVCAATPTGEERLRAEYGRAGFVVIRHFFEMRTDLRDLSPLEWPDGITSARSATRTRTPSGSASTRRSPTTGITGRRRPSGGRTGGTTCAGRVRARPVVPRRGRRRARGHLALRVAPLGRPHLRLGADPRPCGGPGGAGALRLHYSVTPSPSSRGAASAGRARRRRRHPTGAVACTSAPDARPAAERGVGEAVVSTLRARCPRVGRSRPSRSGRSTSAMPAAASSAPGWCVPRAWGRDGDPMAEAAALPLAFPESRLSTRTDAGAVARRCGPVPATPAHPGRLLLRARGRGRGACGAPRAARRRLARRARRPEHARVVAVRQPVGDAATAAFDSGVVEASDLALVGARNLDPPEEAFIAEHGVHRDDVAAALDGADAVYVALDADVLDEHEVPSFFPEPGGLPVDAVAACSASSPRPRSSRAQASARLPRSRLRARAGAALRRARARPRRELEGFGGTPLVRRGAMLVSRLGRREPR